jgi:hypothetical protein
MLRRMDRDSDRRAAEDERSCEQDGGRTPHPSPTPTRIAATFPFEPRRFVRMLTIGWQLP